MKGTLIFTLLVAGLINNSHGQKNAYGISFALADGLIAKQALDGGPSYDLNTGFSIGLQYSRKLTNKLHLVTGANWYSNTVTVTPNFHPDVDVTPKDYNVQLLYVPLFLRIDLSKYFFVSGGFIADFDITDEKKITSQSGMGAGLGIGLEVPVRDKFAIQFNPYVNLHGILLTKHEDYPERICDAGLRFSFIVRKS